MKANFKIYWKEMETTFSLGTIEYLKSQAIVDGCQKWRPTGTAVDEQTRPTITNMFKKRNSAFVQAAKSQDKVIASLIAEIKGKREQLKEQAAKQKYLSSKMEEEEDVSKLVNEFQMKIIMEVEEKDEMEM
jgi:hypothetical protein